MITDSNGNRLTGYIKLPGDKKFYVSFASCSATSVLRAAFYSDNTGTFIERVVTKADIVDGNRTNILVDGSGITGAEYVRLCYDYYLNGIIVVAKAQSIKELFADSLVQDRGVAMSSIPVILDSDWQNGGINGTTGEDGASAYVIRTPYYCFKGKMVFTGVERGENETADRVYFVYFYDANRNFLYRQALVRNNTWHITVGRNDTYYVRFTYGFSSTSGITVESYGKDNLIADWGILFYESDDLLKKENIEYGTIGPMVEVAETYFNQAYSADNQIVYESTCGIYTTPENGQGIKATVCSQFMQSLLMGIPYEESRYVLNKNWESYWGYTYDSTTDASFSGVESDYLTSDQIAKYCDDKGWLIPFDEDHINIRPGDVVFYSTEGRTDKYLEITHCAICLYLCTTGMYTIHAGSNNPRPVDGEDVGIAVERLDWDVYRPSYYARLPLISSRYANALVHIDYHTYEGTYTAGATKHIARLSFNDLQIGFYSITWEDTGNGETYFKINAEGANVNAFPFKQGNKLYVVFYAPEPIKTIDIRAGGNGTTYNVSNIKIYKGYKTI